MESSEKIMLKMGIRAQDGFIYFNELLYRLMRYKYLDFELNQTMRVKELIMQYKLYELTLIQQNDGNLQKKKMQMDFLQGYDNGGNKNSVNPFVTQMFLRASFAAWFNLLKKKQREERRKEIIAKVGDDEFLLKSRLRKEGLEANNDGEAEMEAILVINEEEFDITDSDDDDEYDDEV